MGYGTISSIGKRRRRHMDVTLELACVAVIIMGVLLVVDTEYFFFLFCPLFLISGWITLYSEKIPYPGMVVTAQNCRVTVLTMSKHRVTSVRLTVLRRQEEETDVDDFLAEEDAAVESENQNSNREDVK